MKPTFQENGVEIYQGDCREVLRSLPDESVHCVVTSPPYWGLRDYGTALWEGGSANCDHNAPRHADRERTFPVGTGFSTWTKREETARPGDCPKCGATRIDRQIGLEDSPVKYIATMRQVFAEVRRVLRSDGTLWLNMGDSYAGGGNYRGINSENTLSEKQASNRGARGLSQQLGALGKDTGCKPKDLVGIPWALATALRDPHYIGRVERERDRVWLAATIDAEGCICGFSHERKDDGRVRTGTNITITNSSVAMLSEAHRIWPASHRIHNNHGSGHLGNLATYRWIAHGIEDEIALIRELYPYLIVKKMQALVVYNLLLLMADAKRLGKGLQGVAVREKRAKLVAWLGDLNQGRAVDLPVWLQEPPSLYETGWYLRQDIVWSKPNPMPESVTDRCTKAHEYIFLLSKSERYYYNADAIKEESIYGDARKPYAPGQVDARGNGHDRNGGKIRESVKRGGFNGKTNELEGREAFRAIEDYRNRRSVWTVTTQPFPEAHFATFPEDLIKPCILAGCPEGGTVLDPFGGSGTTAKVARELHCKAILVELNPDYIQIAARRLSQHVFNFAENRAGGVAPRMTQPGHEND